MNLTFTAEQQMMQRLVRDFVRKEVEPEVARMEAEKRFPSEVIAKMSALGFMGIPISKEYGGAGMDFTSYVIAIHEISKVSAALGVILSVHTSVGTKPIVDFGTNAQVEKYVPKLASGAYIGAFALTEPSAGSDAASIRLKAVKQGTGYILDGAKVFITNGKEADTFIVFAKTDEVADIDGITAFIVERETVGFTIGKSEEKMGLHGSSTVSLNFDHCYLDAEQVLGKEGEGFKVAMANLNIGRVGIAAQALGIAEGALESSIKYAKECEQFGKKITNDQGILFKLADMATEVEAAKCLVYQAASLIQSGKPSVKAVSMAKKYAATIAMKVAVDAVQIFGGYGYTEDYFVERFFRDAKVTSIYEGTTEIQNIVIAKRV